MALLGDLPEDYDDDYHDGGRRWRDVEEFERTFQAGVHDEADKDVRINCIVAGKVGVGKSTLLNAMFGVDLAKTGGVGARVTERVERFTHPTIPISVYDAPGIELGASEAAAVSAEYIKVIHDNLHDAERRIHFALYCVNGLSGRFESVEEEVVRALAQEVHVALVLTQCPTERNRRSNELARYIAGRGLTIIDQRPFLTLAIDIEPEEDGESARRSFGMSDLAEALASKMDEATARGFVRYQQVSLILKVKEAKRVINSCATQAGGIGLVGTPFYDAIPLGILQFRMLGKITAAMGFRVDVKAVTAAITGLMGVAQTARVGASFLKLAFPGGGMIINAAVASATTKALGEAYLQACSNILRRQMAGEVVSDQDITAQVINELGNLRKRTFWRNN